MSLQNIALCLTFFGSCFVGLSQQFGFGSGWGGKISFKTFTWRFLNGSGWLMLVLGFGIQLLEGIR